MKHSSVFCCECIWLGDSLKQSINMEEALEEAGNAFECVKLGTGGHDLLLHYDEVTNTIAIWFRNHM